jgi:hypothetical protein
MRRKGKEGENKSEDLQKYRLPALSNVLTLPAVICLLSCALTKDTRVLRHVVRQTAGVVVSQFAPFFARRRF